MARRYRYAIIKKKEPGKGKLSVGLAIASLLLFVAAVAVAYIALGGLSQVLTAIEEVVRFFRDELNFNVCEIHKS